MRATGAEGAEGSPLVGPADEDTQRPKRNGSPEPMHVRRIENLDEHHEMPQDPQDLLEPPSPRTQTEKTGAIPQAPWMDRPADELYVPIIEVPDLEYRLYPATSRALPGAEAEPTGVINGERCQPADAYATTESSWIPNYPQSHPSPLVDYDILEQWLSQHLPVADQLDALVIFTDTRPLERVSAWRHQAPVATQIQPQGAPQRALARALRSAQLRHRPC